MNCVCVCGQGWTGSTTLQLCFFFVSREDTHFDAHPCHAPSTCHVPCQTPNSGNSTDILKDPLAVRPGQIRARLGRVLRFARVPRTPWTARCSGLFARTRSPKDGCLIQRSFSDWLLPMCMLRSQPLQVSWCSNCLCLKDRVLRLPTRETNNLTPKYSDSQPQKQTT